MQMQTPPNRSWRGWSLHYQSSVCSHDPLVPAKHPQGGRSGWMAGPVAKCTGARQQIGRYGLFAVCHCQTPMAGL